MALVETLISQITDDALRDAIAAEVRDLKKRLEWGIVFERHLPEITRLLDAPVKVGSAVWERRAAKPKRFRVRAVEGDEFVVAAEPLDKTAAPDAPTTRIARADALVERAFSEPVFPTLTSIGSVRRGPADRPSHAVIEGENYHALAALLAAYEGQIDVLYLDPPYNTGDKDWAYNNDYVDPTDRFRSSKWLAFMERRLTLGRRLLRHDGVLVVAVDKNEHAHLVMLLEQVFKGHEITSVTVAHNPRGIQGDNFSYTNDFSVFVVKKGQTQIARRVLDESDVSPLRNWGTESRRTDAKNCFYPIYVRDGEIVRFGELAPDDFHPAGINVEQDDGTMEIWPLDPSGEAKWRYARQTVESIRGQLVVKWTGRGREKRWDIFIRKDDGPYKTVWVGNRYDASTHGKQVLTALGVDFDFPKSIYTMRDVIHAAAGNKREALILDFFAGSGTTLHGTLMLNREDGGQRRCILVTNNEVRSTKVGALHRAGHFRGDPEFEAAGVFESATRPRVEAAITGQKPDGTAVVGQYLDERPYAEGFEENVEFFRLDYLDPTAVEMGLRFAELHPLLWLAAGGVGERQAIDPGQPYALPAGTTYGVLFDPSGMPELLAGLEGRPEVKTVFIIADSEASFADLAASLPGEVQAVQLYRRYIETMRGALA